MSRRRGYVITVHSLKRDVRSHELTNVADVTPDQAPKRASIAPLQFRSSAAQHSAPYQTHHPVSSARLPPRRLLSSIPDTDWPAIPVTQTTSAKWDARARHRQTSSAATASQWSLLRGEVLLTRHLREFSAAARGHGDGGQAVDRDAVLEFAGERA